MKYGFIFIILLFTVLSRAQPPGYVLRPPVFTIDFGAGNAPDPNSDELLDYRRVFHSCPGDGYYSLTSRTGDCFHGDWHTIVNDHTGNINGNMMLVNVGYSGGAFLKTPVTGLKSNTIYEVGLWLINLCRPTKKCPSVLLPNLNVQLETTEGKTIAAFLTGDVPRIPDPRWHLYRADFTMPAFPSTLMLVMSDNVPGGCGNDFALDDITFRECVPQITQASKSVKKTPIVKKSVAHIPTKKVAGKIQAYPVNKLNAEPVSKSISPIGEGHEIMPPAPLVLKTRENIITKKIETEAGNIKVDVYDDGEVDGDSVSIYHNNTLIRSHMLLSQRPISFTITVDSSQSHHEITMVAENLGSIPPNTSVMIVTTATKRYEVFISTNEEKNARVVFDLKK